MGDHNQLELESAVVESYSSCCGSDLVDQHFSLYFGTHLSVRKHSFFSILLIFLLHSQELLPLSWPFDAPPQQVVLDLENPFALYQAALYSSVMTLTSIGYGDYTATTTGERVFFVFYVFFNVWILALIVGTVTSWLQNAEKSRVALADELDDVKAYCSFRGLPPGIGAEMQRFLRFRASAQGYEGTDFDALADLTPALRSEVAMHMRDTVFKHFGLARIVDTNFLTALVLRLKRERRSQGEYLMLQGTSARKFFILTDGKASLLQNQKELLVLQEPHCCFGESAL